jgi:hypothetical protein
VATAGFVRAQDAPPITPVAPEAPAPSSPASDDAPAAQPGYVFAPDILSPIPPGELLKTLNTPSGSLGFGTRGPLQRGLRLYATESLRFDDNVRRLQRGVQPGIGRSRADSYSVTNAGVSYATQLGLQTLFFRADGGLTRYRENSDLNSKRYSIAAGVNWRVGSPCSGSLTLSSTRSETELQDIIFGDTQSLSTVDRVDWSGRCRIFGRVHGTFGINASRNQFSTAAANDYRRVAFQAGLEYAVPRFHTLGVEVVRSHLSFYNRPVASFAQSATDVEQTEYRAYYRYIVSPKTTLSISGGAVQSTTSSPLFSQDRLQPTFAAGVTWRPGPKLLVSINAQRTVSPPQGNASSYQSTDFATLSITYAYSRKLSFAAAFAETRSSFAVGGAALGSPAGRSTRTRTYSLDANYRITPFWSASLGYRFTERTDKLTQQSVQSNLYTVSLTYRR